MKAIVLAAGLGTRLGDLTRDLPKALLPVAGRPLLEHVLRHLASHGFDEIAVNLHHHADLVRERFGDGKKLGIGLTYAYEPELLGTAGTVASLRGFIGRSAPVLVHYGDVVTDHDFTEMFVTHRRNRARATFLVHERLGSNSVVVLDERQRIVEFFERPGADHPARRRSSWANSGVCILEPGVLDAIPPPPCDLARDVLPRLAGRPGVFGHRLEGYRIAVDSPTRHREADRLLSGAAAARRADR